MKTKRKMWLIVAGFVIAAATATFSAYFQSFETDTFDWTGATRVATMTHGVPTKIGAFHAEAQQNQPFTRWGGYSQTFPPGGYTTSVDIYLDISSPYMTGSLMPYPNDTRFDWTSAISTPQCGHRRDFAFNAGFYTNIDSTGAGPRFVISASNNTGRGSSFPKNPGRTPYTITLEGWYTFEHRFRDNAGILAVDLTIKNAAGAPLMTWTLSDPSDVIGVTVGGNRYGWFAQNEFPYLGFDTSMLLGFQDYCTLPESTAGAKATAGGWIEVVNGKGTFGVTAKANASGSPSGNVTYQDHGALARTVKSTAVTSVTLTQGGRCATILGNAKVNNTTDAGFQLDICDNAEPGKDADTFSIVMSDGYVAGGKLGGGNVQIK